MLQWPAAASFPEVGNNLQKILSQYDARDQKGVVATGTPEQVLAKSPPVSVFIKMHVLRSQWNMTVSWLITLQQ
ncbi:hypothetical protein VMCG_04526 [Cytospora schulzeri]|uniref:Uncharacterized protein n=1 Tax=Cytospora schulzeri TaxID=448051 RepID=A0A423WRT9_9PEZI|nr:hypothetical protein VMCG_04526 [Valsa malicola]